MSIQASSTLLHAAEPLQAPSTVESAFRVLFVGENRGAFISLRKFLEKRGALCSFSKSPGHGLADSGPESFHLILDMTPFQADHLALQALGGARCNIFRYF